MISCLRQEIACLTTTMVVKVGTRVLTHEDGRLNEDRIAQLADELHEVMTTGRRVVLISSGAVGAGMGRLGLERRPTDVAQRQAVAAIGQGLLVEAYERHFRKLGRTPAQILLTADDLDRRTSYLNARNTILTLMEDYHAVPIINENDTTSIDELQTTFGDNDRLAAMVTNLIQAPLLVLLSDVDGLYDNDPRDPSARRIPVVAKIDDSVRALCCDRLTGLSRGGMASKLQAAHLVTTAGGNVIIGSGREPGVLRQIVRCEEVGTLFLTQNRSLTARQRWIGLTVQPRGHLIVNACAKQALLEQGRSLLPVGVTKVLGHFGKGDVVGICDATGEEFARGLSNYNADNLRRIRGLKASEIPDVLGTQPYEEVVHRNNLVLVR
ncbi:MAG: glutamate 5-kinase [Planctomycetia bacterium]|nr:glutamate 5-kinase [Planctomycetia bacterium]